MKVIITGSADFIEASLMLGLLFRRVQGVDMDHYNDYCDPNPKDARLKMFHLC